MNVQLNDRFLYGLEKFTATHINSVTTFYRYLIPKVLEDERALYLDCDLIVTGNLDELFYFELGDNYLAAGLDDLVRNLFNNPSYFNAGVLLINNKKWRSENLFEKLVDYTITNINQIPDADQGVLNKVVDGKWAQLPYRMNYLVGSEYVYNKHNQKHLILRQENEIPLIIHYNSLSKPWEKDLDIPLKEYYWFYYHLDWQTIIDKHKNEKT